MPGFLLDASSAVSCVHGGRAQSMAPFPRVLVNGIPVVTMASPHAVVGCPFVPPANGPCVTAQWVVGATRVLAGGFPVLLQTSQAVCVPTGTPVLITFTQTKVAGL
jgi:hypothetical protein